MHQSRGKVAIIGLSHRLPGNCDNSCWQDLIEKRDLVTEITDERWATDPYFHPDSGNPGTSYTWSAGVVENVTGFDAGFFGISPREAAMMDPQQRLLLELTWEAIENAGVPAAQLRGSDCGVYVGISSADYSFRMADDMGAVDSGTATGNTSSISANRISYCFDLQGPSMAIDTACSSTMVAFHQACQSILTGESSQALVGGVNMLLNPYGFVAFSKATMLSETGRCQVFDANADGYVRSEGGGVFYLKDYQQALKDGNSIVAVVAATAANTDGNKSTMTVPSHQAQVRLMQQAYQQAGLHPDQIDYLEAHGTGTPVGDPIECTAIGKALGKLRKEPLPIGSVKSNMGHLESASAVAGLVKAILSLQHRMVPATISMKTPNPHIPFADLNIQVTTDNLPLPTTGTLTIGVNSFGFGGANAHAVLQTPPVSPKPVAGSDSDQQTTKLPLFVSAQNQKALRQNLLDYRSLLLKSSQDYYDIAYASRYQRDQLKQGALVMASSKEEAAELIAPLEQEDDLKQCPGIVTSSTVTQAEGPVFVYDGNGCQWHGMGCTLLEQSALFRQVIEEMDQLFQELANYSLIEELLAVEDQKQLEKTEIAQPLLFALQVGITRLLEAEGIRPVAVVGHSVGEVAAAWASGALTLEQAVRVIYYRSHHQGKTAGLGQMTAAALGVDAATALIEEYKQDQICIAGINSKKGVTLAGDADALNRVEARLAEQGVRYKRLDLDYAFHSPVMDSLQAGLEQDLADLTPHKNNTPFYSTVMGGLLDGQRLDYHYWWQNVRQPVQFKSAIDALLEVGHNVFVEVGPHPILRGYLAELMRDSDTQGSSIDTLSRSLSTLDAIEVCVAQVVMTLQPRQLTHWFDRPGHYVDLPSYNWQRTDIWHPVSEGSQGLLDRHYLHPLLGYALKHNENTWEVEIDLGRQPWLVDHQVGDAVVFPGAGYVEMVHAAARQLQQGRVCEIEDVEILSPLVLTEKHPKTLRLEISPDSGDVAIKSRSSDTDDQWTPHLKARLLSDAREQTLDSYQLCVPEESPNFDRVKHTDYMESAGLDYGPVFSLVDHGWLLQDEVCVVLESLPEQQIDLDQFILPPAMLDGPFQLIAHLVGEDESEGFAYIPVRFGRIHTRQGQQLSVKWATAKLLKRTPHGLSAEFVLYDEARQPVCVVKEARFKRVQLHKKNAQHLDFLEYHLTPAPDKSQKAHSSIDAKSFISRLQFGIGEWQKEARHQLFSSEVDPLLNSLAELYLAEILGRLYQAGPELSHEQLSQHEERLPGIGLLLHHLITFGLNQNYIETTTAGWRVLEPIPSEVTSEDLWRLLVTDYPEYAPLALMIGRAGDALHNLLVQGQPVDLGIQALDYEKFIARITREGVALLAGLVQQTLADELKHQGPGERLGVVEINQGAARIVPQLISQVDFNCCELTAISLTDTGQAENTLLQHNFPLFNVADGREPLSADSAHQLALVELCFQGSEQLESALELLKGQLAQGARVLFYGLEQSDWVDLAMGGSKEWWSVEEGVNQSRQYSTNQWRQLLEAAGFREESFLNLEQSEGAGTFVLLAEFTSTAKQQDQLQHEAHRWLILSPAEEATQMQHILVEALERQGQTATAATLLEDRSLEETLSVQNVDLSQVDRVLCLTGDKAQGLLSGLVNDCDLTKQVSDLAAKTAPDTLCWGLTRGVGVLYPSDQAQLSQTYAQTGQVADDAALWGFVRTLMNEALHTQWHLVDLPSAELSEICLDSLLNELLNPGDEAELVLDDDGKRFAPRLRVETVPVPVEPVNQEETVYSLGFELPGQLRNLRWEARTLAELHAGSVEIEVRATGLNFRDVMYALGMLSDEAVESGFAGPTLGMEFAGEVLSVGEGVTALKPGDRVLGFGSSSFSNRIVASVETVTPIPDHIDYGAAATIPTTFFTAYYALKHLGQLETGERVLIHGAAGGVGLAAIQVAQWLGAEIHATAGSDEKRDYLRFLGIEHIYDSRSYDFAEEILETTGDGVDVVLNSLSGEALNRNFRVLKPFGRFLELGKRDFYENTHIGLRPFRNNISYFGIDADQIMQVKPALTKRLFTEMIDLFHQQVFSPLPFTVFDAARVAEAFRFMQQARQIGKIVVTYPDDPSVLGLESSSAEAPAAQYNASSTGSYLVTGGLGGFGLRTARWLVEKGARHLVLISRSGPQSEEAVDAIKEMEAAGCQVMARSCDVTDKAALQELLNEQLAEMPPLVGVIHAATVIEDSLASNLDVQKIHNSLAAKVMGASHLHELTKGYELELFLTYSSASTLYGNPGQSSYVAANMWLEALTAHRRKQGLVATCVRWAAIDDVGFLARNTDIRDALQSRTGGSAISSDKGLKMMERMLVEDAQTLAIAELQWPSLGKFLPSGQQPKFREIALASGKHEADDGYAEIHQLLESLSEEELHQAIVEMLKEELASVLLISTTAIDPYESVYNLGLDSLMGVEFMVGIESRLGVQIPVMALSEASSIHKIATKVVDMLNDSRAQSVSGEANGQVKALAASHGVDTNQADEEIAEVAERVESAQEIKLSVVN